MVYEQTQVSSTIYNRTPNAEYNFWELFYALVIRSDQFDRENPINGRRPSNFKHERNNEVSAGDSLDNIDENLKSIENHIIDDTIKYTGSKQGL